MKNLIVLIIVSISTFSFSQTNKMKWHNGSIETAMAKAEKLDAILFIYVYPENSALTKEVNKLYFTPLPKGTWASSKDVVDLYNENMISVKMTAQAARRELGNTYDLSKPIFLWMNSINKKPIKGEVINSKTIRTLNLKYTSREILLNEFEKTGRSHPFYEFKNFKTIIKNKNCDDIFCYFENSHRIFKKMPAELRYVMYDELSKRPGEIGSIELQWIMKQKDFINGENEDRMKVFSNALRYTYYKNTPNIKELTYNEIDEGYRKYANDNMLKPLGSYANSFKKYLIDNEEGKGFVSVVNPLMKKAKFTFEDNANGWMLNDVEGGIVYNYIHAISKDKITLMQFHFGKEDKKLKESNEAQVNKWLEDYKFVKILDQGFYKINNTYGYKSLVDFRAGKNMNVDFVYEFNFTSYSYNFSFIGYIHNYDSESIKRIESFFDNFKLVDEEVINRIDENDSKTETTDNSKTLQTIKFESGEISAKGFINTKTGEKTGFWFDYNKEGRVVYTTTYTNNQDYTRTYYYPNSEVSTFQIFKNKKLWRIMEGFDLDSKQTLKDGNGVYKTYYPESRQLQHTAQIKNGMRDGVANWYYKKGQLKQSVIYKYSEDQNYAGLRWEVLIMFDKDGNPLDTGTLKNGNGTWNKYNDEGKLIGTTTYKNGIEVR